jgi:hypothetical protein
MAISVYFLGKSHGVTGMVVGYSSLGLLFGLPSALLVFAKYGRALHAN